MKKGMTHIGRPRQERPKSMGLHTKLEMHDGESEGLMKRRKQNKGSDQIRAQHNTTTNNLAAITEGLGVYG